MVDSLKHRRKQASAHVRRFEAKLSNCNIKYIYNTHTVFDWSVTACMMPSRFTRAFMWQHIL